MTWQVILKVFKKPIWEIGQINKSSHIGMHAEMGSVFESFDLLTVDGANRQSKKKTSFKTYDTKIYCFDQWLV